MMSVSVDLGNVSVCSEGHEMGCVEWWNSSVASIRRQAFLTGVYVVRNGLHSGLDLCSSELASSRECSTLRALLAEQSSASAIAHEQSLLAARASSDAELARAVASFETECVDLRRRLSASETESLRSSRQLDAELSSLRVQLQSSERLREEESLRRQRACDQFQVLQEERESEMHRQSRERLDAQRSHLESEIRSLREEVALAADRGRREGQAELEMSRAELARFESRSQETERLRILAAASEAREICRQEMCVVLESSRMNLVRLESQHASVVARLEQVDGVLAQEQRRHASDALRDATERARSAEEALARFKGTNHGKGSVGEQTLSGLLRGHFRSHEIEEKGFVDHSQDVWMRVDGGRILAFESKNKKCVTRGDVDKFYRDIDAMPSCVGAMLVSLATPNIPGKGSFCMEVYKGIPVLFVGFVDFAECDRFFLSYASVLLTLALHAESARQDHDVLGDANRLLELVVQLSPCVDRIRKLKGEFIALGSGLRGMLRTVDGMQSELEGVFSSMDRLLSTYAPSPSCPPPSLPPFPAPPCPVLKDLSVVRPSPVSVSRVKRSSAKK